MQQFIEGLAAGINLEPKATQLVVGLGLKASTTGNNNTLNLDDLDKHLGRFHCLPRPHTS